MWQGNYPSPDTPFVINNRSLLSGTCPAFYGAYKKKYILYGLDPPIFSGYLGFSFLSLWHYSKAQKKLAEFWMLMLRKQISRTE